MYLADLMPKSRDVWKFWKCWSLEHSFAINIWSYPMKLGPGCSALFMLSKSYSMNENGDDYGTLQ